MIGSLAVLNQIGTKGCAVLNSFFSFQNRIVNRMVGPSPPEEDSISIWRAKILFSILFSGLILGSLTFFLSVRLILEERAWGLLIADICGFIGCLALLLVPRIKFAVRASLTLLTVYMIGLAIILYIGPLSGGHEWLFAFAVLAGVLIGNSAAFAAILLNTLALTIVGLLISTGKIGPGFSFFQTPQVMIAAGANFILLNAITAFSVSALVKGLFHIFEKKEALTRHLKEERCHLIETKQNLETEIKKHQETEKALRESEEKYKDIVRHAPAGIAEVDLTTLRFTRVNDIMCEFTGYTKDEMLTMDPFSLVQGKHRQAVEQRLEKLFAGARSLPATEYIICDKKGREKSVLVNSRYFFENEAPRKMTMVFHDLTEIKKAEQEKKDLEAQLFHSQKLESLGILAGGVAHDFNNLLHAAQGRISLMGLEAGLSNTRKEHLNALEEIVTRAANLTRQLLGLARKGKYEIQPLDINSLLRSTASMFGETYKNVQIHEDLITGSLVVEGDKNQLGQVLLNLLINASQAMPQGGSITLKTDAVRSETLSPFISEPASGTYAKISIIDTGTGIEESIRQKIFDPFFTTKEGDHGTGLGLSSAYGIIKNHGGLLTVDSQVGLGSTFSIFLPLSEKKPETPQPEKSVPAPGQGHILLVDDETMITDIGRDFLEDMGYRVSVSNGGEQAIEMIKSQGDTIDMVILDFTMPGLDGGQVFDRIRDLFPSMPVILASGHGREGVINDIMERGCRAFIQKPYRFSDLSQRVREILGAKEEKK